MKNSIPAAVGLALSLGAMQILAQGPGGGRGPGAGGAASATRSPEITQTTYFDPVAAARGEKVFTGNCASCHGPDARGGKGKPGPDLFRSPLVLDDIGGQQIGEFLKYGRPEKNMPKFDLAAADVSDLCTWIHSVVAQAGERFTYKRPNVFSGDARAGEAFFNGSVGKCNTCHSATGDMKGLATRNNDDAPVIQGLILNGGGRAGGRGGGGRGGGRGGGTVTPSPTAITATVTLESGEVIKGYPMSVDDFVIAIRLPDGETRSWPRNGDWPKYETTNPLQAHVDLLLKYTDDDIHNLAAYLETLK